MYSIGRDISGPTTSISSTTRSRPKRGNSDEAWRKDKKMATPGYSIATFSASGFLQLVGKVRLVILLAPGYSIATFSGSGFLQLVGKVRLVILLASS
jgi:hypothetical protein